MSTNRPAGAVLGVFLASAFGLAAISTAQPRTSREGPLKVVVYPIPDAVQDSPFEVEVNGQAVPIEQAAHIQKVYYARVQVQGKVVAHVAVRADGDVEFDLQPERFRTDMRTEPKVVSFSMDGPGPRILHMTSNGVALPKLFVIVDPHDPTVQPARGEGLFNIQDFGATGEGDQTENIQKALDACAAAGGGTVYLGPGIWTTGMIRVGDNTRLYLAPGCVLRAVDDPERFPRTPRMRQFIFFDRSKNSSLCGYGVVDGQGGRFNSDPRFEKHSIRVIGAVGAENLRIENVVLRDSHRWTLHPSACRDVTIDNLKILSDWAVRNTDGIDPDGCENVTITNYLGHCSDDAVVVKTTHWAYDPRPARNIVVKDSVVVCRKTCLKIGTESKSDISDVHFENIDCIRSSRAIGLWVRDSATYSNITFKDIRADLIEIEGEKLSGQPIRITVARRKKESKLGKVRGVRIEALQVAAPFYSILHGDKESPIEDVVLKDCRWCVTPSQRGADELADLPLIDIRCARNITFSHVTRRRADGDRGTFKDFVRLEDAENARVDTSDVP